MKTMMKPQKLKQSKRTKFIVKTITMLDEQK